MPDKRYKTPNGMIVSEQELSAKYGDKLPELLGNNTFIEINETVYTAPNGKKETESVLREKYGDRFDELIGNNTFKVDYEVKKKDDGERTFTAKELDSATKDAQSGGSLATSENKYADRLKYVERAEQREQAAEIQQKDKAARKIAEDYQKQGVTDYTITDSDIEKQIAADNQEVKKQEESWGRNLWRQLQTGSADLGAMVASIPETLYNIGALPQNIFSKVTGVDFTASADKFKKDYGVENPVLDFYVAEVDKLEKETEKFNERYDETGIFENLKKGNYSDAFQLLGSGITRSAPVSLAMMAGGATVGTGKLVATATPLFVEGNYQQLKEENPEMSEAEATIKALGMAGAETLFESIGTGTIGRVYKDILVKEGAEQAPKIFKQGLIEMYETALKKYGIPASMTGEGIEEVATTITQNMISGKDPFENVADSFLQGVGGGMLYGTPLTVQKAKTAVVEGVARNRVGKTLKDTDYNSIASVYDFEDNNLDATKLDLSKKDVNRKVLEKELAKEVSNGKIDANGVTRALENFDRTKKVNSQLEGVELSETQKSKAASLLFEKQKLEQKVKDKDPHLFSKENARISEINNELANVRNETTETPQTETPAKQAEKPEVLPREGEKEENVINKENDFNKKIDQARQGDKGAINELKEYGINFEKEPVVRFVGQSEVDALLNNEKIEGKNKNNGVDVTKDVEGRNVPATNTEYRVNFKEQGFDDKKEGSKVKMKNEQDGWIEGGYSIEDVSSIEEKQEDGTWKEVYNSNTKDNNEAKQTIDVEVFAKGDGGTKGVFKSKDGKLYKSATPLSRTIKDGKVVFEEVNKETQEHEILSKNQDLKHLPKVGEMVNTSEGMAFEIEPLQEVKEGTLTLAEIKQIDETIKELNEKRNIAINDRNTVMRRENGEIVLVDLSTASENSFKDRETSTYNIINLLNKRDKGIYNAEKASENIYEERESFDIPTTKKEYSYLLTQRPPSIGTHPLGQIKDAEEVKLGNRTAYRITYDNPLSVDEMAKYELTEEMVDADTGRIFQVGSSVYLIDGINTENEIKVRHYFGDNVKKETFTQRGFRNLTKDAEEITSKKVESAPVEETKPQVKRINPEGVKGEFDVETDANGNVTKILKTDGTEVPKFVERKTPKGKVILAKNANYTKIEAEALGVKTDNETKIERQAKVAQALDEFTPSNEYEHALDAMARGAKVSLESAQKETGLSAKEVKWATGFNKESELKSVEALAEDIVANSEQELDLDEVRNALIEIISSKGSIVNLEDEIVSYSEEAQNRLQEQEAQAYLGRLSEKDISLLEAIEAEDNYISELTDQEAIEYFEQEYEKRIPTEQTGETETNEIGTVESDSVQERDGAQEQEVNLSADLKLPDFIANIDKAIDKLDQFGKETLGLNLPVAVARQALQAMKLAALTAKSVADITSAGINAVKKTKWFKGLNATDQAEIENNFTEYLNKPYIPDTGKTRAEIEKEVDGMTGTNEEIINNFSDSREKMIAEDYLNRKKTVTPEEAKKIVEESYKKADAEINNKGNEKAVNTWFRKVAQKIWDRQFLPKFLLNNAGGTTVRNYMIASKGASGYAKLIYDKAAKKIYKGLSSADVKLLDKIIQERRIIAIDETRRAMGKPAVVHPDFKNEAVSKAYLEEVRKEIGDKKYNDLNKRADAYFETFRGLLDAMYESGIISKQSRDSFFDIDYQPREFLKFLKNAEDELAINEMGRAGTGLASEQIKKLEDGSNTALIYDSQYLLSRAVNVRAKSIAMNNATKKFEQFMREQEKKVSELREKDKPTKKDRKTIKYFDELSKKVKLNPITGFTDKGNPKYLYDKIPKGFKAAYFYTNGVKQMLLMEEKFFDAYTDANKAIWKNQDIKEKAALASGTGLVKALATGNNPTFFLTNTPRDLMFIATFSDAYGSFVPLNIAKLVRDAGKGIRDIYKKNDNFQKFVKYGGMMDYLYQQGEFKGTTGINKVIRKGIDKKVRDRFKTVFEAATLNQLQMYSEIGFRMAVFNRSVLKQMRENGVKTQEEFEQKFGDDSKDMLDDIYTNAVAAARNTTDFNQGGTVVKDMDAVIPYLNAATQGTRVAVDAFRERPVETTFRAAQSTAIMTAIPTAIGILALSALRSDDDEDKDLSDTELYIKFKNGVSQYERSNYMLIPTGQRTDKGEFKYIRIAKSQSLSPFLSLAEGLQMDMMKKMVGDKSESTTISDIGFTLEHNVSPFEIGLTNNITKVPFIKASMSYATGYDFFREQDLSYMRGKVPVAAEGYESDQVEDFYKKIGEESGMSPARFKAAVESLITTPSTTPYVGMLYGGMDAMLSDKDGKQVMQKFAKDMLKSTVKRVSKETSDFNRRIADSKFLKEKEAEIEIGQMKVKNEVKRIAERYLLNEITDEQAANEIQELTKDSPFETKRAFNKFKDIIRHPKVPRVVYDLKYADPKLRAIMLVKMFGDGFLEEKDSPLADDIWANKAVNSETIYEYEKLINEAH